MKRSRGRPTQHSADALLVWFVRNAMDRGRTVEQAVREYARVERHGHWPTLLRRYHRVASAFDRTVDETPEFRYRAFRARHGRAPLGLEWLTIQRPTTKRRSLAAMMLMDPKRKPSR